VSNNELEFQCDLLGSVVCEMVITEYCNVSCNFTTQILFQEMLPKQLEKIRDQYVALEKLGELQQKMGSSTSDSSTFVLFLTWSTSKFGNHNSFSTYITMLIFC
jgi:uncharacterized radical SAM superfamily protein